MTIRFWVACIVVPVTTMTHCEVLSEKQNKICSYSTADVVTKSEEHVMWKLDLR
jgi:hypothetical protein